MRHKLQQSPIAGLLLALSGALALIACDSGSDTTNGAGSLSQTAASSSTGDSGGYGDIVNAAEVSEEGYTLGGVAMGDPDAPVTIIEYASLTCPHCAQFHETVLPDLKAQYIDTGQVRYEFRNFILNPIDLAVSMIVRCQPPEEFFPLTDLFFANQRQWLANANDREQLFSDISSLVRRVGISRAEIDQCLASRDLQQQLVELTQTGQQDWGVNATPTLIVAGEKRGVEAQSFEGLSRMIEEEL